MIVRNLRPAVLGTAAMLLTTAPAGALPRLDSEQEAARYFERPDRRWVLSAGWARAPRYWERVVEAAREREVPEEIFFALALIESSFYPYARSPSGAEGMWQFMPATAADFGLHGRPARTSVERSARAAAAYLEKLYRRFGSWELALAAYNAGPGTVSRAIRAVGSSQWPRVRTRLSAETHSYVPKVLYLARERYPRFLQGEPAPEPVVMVEIRSGDTWYGLSRRFGVERQVLRMMNRGELHPGAPLAVPGRSHEVVAGETFYGLATHYGIEETGLRSANPGIESLAIGISLLIPHPVELEESR